MSKTTQRNISFYSQGRCFGLKLRFKRHSTDLGAIRRRLLKFVPKVFKENWNKGFNAGLSGEQSNTFKKKQARRALDKR